MKNRKLLLIASLVLALTMSLGGTLAYLTDTDEAVNVMTLGNVDIEQYEKDAAGNDFKQDQPLYPAYYTTDEAGKITGEITGAIDKVVSVKNVGTADAYVRTLLAFEAGNLNFSDFNTFIHTLFNEEGAYKLTWLETPIEAKGTKYYVACADYGKLAGKTTGDNSLLKVYMDKTATNEIVAQFGDTYEIVVLSQAIQTNNMPDAATAWKESFGEFKADNAAKWLDGVAVIPVNYVSTVAELQEALTKGGTVKLLEDVTATASDMVKDFTYDVLFAITDGKNVTLDLNGNDIIFKKAPDGENVDAIFFVHNSNLTIKGNGNVTQENTDSYVVWGKGDTQIDILGGDYSSSGDSVLVYASGNTAWDPADDYATINVYGGSYKQPDWAENRTHEKLGQHMFNIMNHGVGRINFYGGSFYDFDPAQNVSIDDKSYVKLAEGYVSEKVGDWYVVGEGKVKVVEVKDQATLKAALDAGKDVELKAGTYTFPASSIQAGTTITCAEGTVFEGNSKLNINGATVAGATFSNPTGTAADQTINGTFKDCTFTGSNALRWCYAGENVVFENCVFSGDVYGIHFDGGANEVLFKNCTFSGFNAMGAAVTKLTMEGCTFVGNGKSAYNGINLWGSTDMKDCTFIFDGTSDYEWIDAKSSDKVYTFENCVVSDGQTERDLTAADVNNSDKGNVTIE